LQDAKPRHVIALVLTWEDADRRLSIRQYPALVEVDESNVELNRAFVPDHDRLAEIVSFGGNQFALRVFYREGADGKAPTIFTTQPDVPGTFYVPDGNLLCRFLVRQAEIGDLEKAAEECMAQKSALEVISEIAGLFDVRPAGPAELVKFLKGFQAQARAANQRIDRLIAEASRRNQALQPLLMALGHWPICLRTSGVRKAMKKADQLGPLDIS
jgi:hypothetical protein